MPVSSTARKSTAPSVRKDRMAAVIHPRLQHPRQYLVMRTSVLKQARHIQTTAHILEQLDIRPFQHILEVGYGPGATLQAVAAKLRVGFLAGVDDSAQMHDSAQKRNKKYIHKDLLQLHIGQPQDLPYPARYFHSIYGCDIHYFWPEPAHLFMTLHKLLRSGGMMLMVFEPSWAEDESQIGQEILSIRQAYEQAGLIHVQVTRHTVGDRLCISAKGYKP